MGRIVLDSLLRAKLNGLVDRLEVCDEHGNTVGHFLPAGDYQKLLYAAVEADCPLGPSEMEERCKETGGRSLQEIWKELSQK